MRPDDLAPDIFSLFFRERCGRTSCGFDIAAGCFAAAWASQTIGISDESQGQLQFRSR
jgi:hypothetical protein